MSFSTIDCEIPVQDGFETRCTAVFNSSCLMLIIKDQKIGAQTPDEFYVEFQGDRFWVKKDGDEHMVIEDERSAFTALVFG